MIRSGFCHFQRAFGRKLLVRTSPDLFQARELNILRVWFNWVANSVDSDRIKSVGPDCACAEWLLRNGASVRFKGHSSFVSDYRELMALEEMPEAKNIKVEEIYAKDVNLTEMGFEHLRDCKHINKIKLIFCSYIKSGAVAKLKLVKESLEHLEMRSCFNVEDEGILSLTQLRNLKTLILSDLMSVKKKEECEAILRRELPQCTIDFQK